MNLCNIIYLTHLNTFYWKAIAWKIRQRNWHWIAVLSYRANSSCSHCASACPLNINEFSSRYTLFQFHDDRPTTWEAHVSSRKIVLGVVDIPNLTIAFRITGKKLYFPEIMHEHFMLHPKILQQPHFMTRWRKSWVLWSVICEWRVWKCYNVAGIYWMKNYV